MPKIFEFIRPKKFILIAGLAWLFLLIVPWGGYLIYRGNLYLTFIVDMFRLCVALTVFMLPGALLYILLKRDEESFFDWEGIIPVGFVFSVLIVSVIGLVGRVLGLSSEVVKILFTAIGVIELALFASYQDDRFFYGKLSQSAFHYLPLLCANSTRLGWLRKVSN